MKTETTTEGHFAKGDRVKLSAAGIEHYAYRLPSERLATVTGYSRLNQGPIILWDGRATSEPFLPQFLERIDG